MFTRVIEHYERVSSDPNHKWVWRDASFLAEAVMKGYDSYEMWRRSQGEQARYWVVEFFRRLALALINELRR